MSALLLDEHPPLQLELEIVSEHGPLGSWPLECWIGSCGEPRIEAGTLCTRHAPQSRPA